MSQQPDQIVKRGDSITLELGPVTTLDVNGVRQPFDLTMAGVKLWLTVKRDLDDADPGLVQLTETAGITVNTPATTAKNYATAVIPKTTFADPTLYAQSTELLWDAQVESGTRRETFAWGKLIIVPDVTRA